MTPPDRNWRDAVDGAAVGVFAYRSRGGRPIACAVTPYLQGGDAVVTTTLALPTKAAAAQREGSAALLAGGVEVRGRVEVTVDRTSAAFDGWVREQELRKYPPASTLLAIPGHRCLFPWYVGRVIVRFVDPVVRAVPGGDRATITTIDASGRTRLDPIDEPAGAPVGWRFAAAGAGPACVLVHEETEAMAELRQLRVDGAVVGGFFVAERTVGSLAPQPTGLRAELMRLRSLSRAAKAAAPVVARLAGDGRAAG